MEKHNHAEKKPPVATPPASEALFLNGSWRVYYKGQLLLHEWLHKGPAETALALLEKGCGTVTADGSIKWDPELHLPLLTLESRKQTVYDASNLLQSIMGYLELDNIQRARAVLDDALEILTKLRDSLDPNKNGERDAKQA